MAKLMVETEIKRTYVLALSKQEAEIVYDVLTSVESDGSAAPETDAIIVNLIKVLEDGGVKVRFAESRFKGCLEYKTVVPHEPSA